MSIKISELPQATSVSSNDIVPIVQGGTTKRATKEMMFPTIASTIDSTSTNSEVAGAKAVYDLTRTNLIMVRKTSDQTITVADRFVDTIIPLDTIVSQSGSGFTIDNNKIVIGAGISLIETLFSLSYTPFTNTYTYINIKLDHNGTLSNIAGTYEYNTNNNLKSVSVTGFANVSEGDKIYLVIGKAVTGSANVTINSNVRFSAIALYDAPVSTRSLNLMKSANEEETEEKELEEKEPVEEVKQEETKEPILEEIVQEETKAEGSGDARWIM